MNIPETILYAHDDSPIPEEAKQDDFYISAEKYNPQVLYCTIHCTVLYCTVLYCTVLYCTIFCTVQCCSQGVNVCTVLCLY